MKYFKNTELARLYHVSEKSVRNWIDAAEAGKLELQLHEERGRSYIANVTKNTAIIEELVERGKKFKNTRGAITVSPKPDFYKQYDNSQILDIISSLVIHKEVPLQYTYVDGGSTSWNRYATRQSQESSPNMLTRTIDLFDKVSDSFDLLFPNAKKINVVDLGPGNGLPVRAALERLIGQKKLGRYIAIDISQSMLDILGQNMREWFGDSLTFETHVRDISYERFNDLLVESYANEEEVVNIVCLFGGTLSNFRAPNQVLQTINNSMGTNDVLAYSGYLDSPITRRHFDYDEPVNKKLSLQEKLILDLLNIDDDLYDVSQEFDEIQRGRFTSIIPKKDINIAFELPSGNRKVELRKGKPILIWRHWHNDMVGVINLFDRNRFNVMQAITPDNNYLLTLSKIKTN